MGILLIRLFQSILLVPRKKSPRKTTLPPLIHSHLVNHSYAGCEWSTKGRTTQLGIFSVPPRFPLGGPLRGALHTELHCPFYHYTRRLVCHRLYLVPQEYKCLCIPHTLPNLIQYHSTVFSERPSQGDVGRRASKCQSDNVLQTRFENRRGPARPSLVNGGDLLFREWHCAMLSVLSWGTTGASHTKLGNPQVLLEVFLGRTCPGEGICVKQGMDGGEQDVRHDRDTFRADPGENNLSRCRPEPLRGCEDWFVDWAIGVTCNRTNEIPGQSIASKKKGCSSRTRDCCKPRGGCCVRQRT